LDGLIDTSVIIDIYRGFAPALAWRNANQHKTFIITPIVWLEAVEGASNKVNQQQVIRLLSVFQMEYLTEDDQKWAMSQLVKFKLSHNIGMMDCLIAAPAHRLNLPLYTRNVKHFTPMIPTLVNVPY
jgi:predicted nucleic acid-binding protein